MPQRSPASDKSDVAPQLHRNRMIAVGFASGFGITVAVVSTLFLLVKIVGFDRSRTVGTPKDDHGVATSNGPDKAKRTANFVPLPQEITIDLYPDPPVPKDSNSDGAEYLEMVAGLVNPQRVQLFNPIGREVLLLPFFKIDMGELTGRWRWTLESTEPAKFVARPRGGTSSQFVSVTVEPNLYADIQSNNEAIRLRKIADLKKSKTNIVKATEVQQIDLHGRRFQFFVSLAHSTANLYYLIYDEHRVITIYLYANLRSDLDEMHRIMSAAELLEFPVPGNVPADVKEQIEAVVERVKALMASEEYEDALRLIVSDDFIARCDERPEMWEELIEKFPNRDKPLLLKTFSIMDFSEATYQPEVDQVSFPYRQRDILWIKQGDRWTLN